MDHGGMSVLAHVKVTLSAIPQFSNRPIMMALLDQCVIYYYSNWPLGLKGYKRRERQRGGLAHLLPPVGQGTTLGIKEKMEWPLPASEHIHLKRETIIK